MRWTREAVRESGRRKRTGVWLFLIGMLVGIILLGRKPDGGAGQEVLGTELLLQAQAVEIEKKVFLKYLLEIRLKQVLIPAVLATTYLGMIAAGVCMIECGAAAGILVSGLCRQFAVKGLLLFLTGGFPHYLLYLPAYLWLYRWCLKTCSEIYFTKVIHGSFKAWAGERILRLLGILAVVIMGCLLESYVNPGLMQQMLGKF